MSAFACYLLRRLVLAEHVPRRRPDPTWGKLLLACALLACPASRAAEETPEPGGIDPRPAPLERLRQRSEAEQDRLRAAALYATGRALLGKDQLEDALGYFERAWQWDPEATTILDEIVPLAFSIERPEEAVRYALVAADRQPTDALLLRRLALYATETDNPDRAVRLYRRWLEHPDTRTNVPRTQLILVELEIGRLEYLAGHPRQASQALERFQQAALPSDGTRPIDAPLSAALGSDLNATWELCALAHIDAERWELAEQALQQIPLGLNEAGQLGYLRARIALGRERPLAAWEHLKQYFQIDSHEDQAAAYELLGRVLQYLNQRDLLLAELAKLHRENPDNWALSLALAQELEHQDRQRSAVELYRRILAQPLPQPAPTETPTETPTASGSSPANDAADATDKPTASLAQRMTAYAGWVRYQAAERDAAGVLKTLEAVTLETGTLSNLGDALTAITRERGLVDRIVNLAGPTGEAQSDCVRAFTLAQLLAADEQYEAAFEQFAKTLTPENPLAQQWTLAWGLDLFLGDAFPTAAQVFRRGASLDVAGETSTIFQYYLSASLEMAHETEEALDVAKQLRASEPTSAEFAARVPWVLYHGKRASEAIAAYEELIRTFDAQRDSETRAVLRDARLVLSNLEVDAGHNEQAEEWLAQVLDEFPEDVGAMNDLGYLWADQNKYLRRARRMIETAVAAQPENAAYRDSLGWVLYRQREFVAAVRELELAVVLDEQQKAAELLAEDEVDAVEEDDNADAAALDELVASGPDGLLLDHLAEAYLQVGRLDDAITTWQTAAGIFAANQDSRADEIRNKIQTHTRSP